MEDPEVIKFFDRLRGPARGGSVAGETRLV